MTPEQFVDAVRDTVQTRAVDAGLSALERPPGRRPSPHLVEVSTWYRQLSAQDKSRVRGVATLVARQAVFGFLTVLDGARVIDNGPEKGEFRLLYRKGDREWDLTPTNGVALHELLTE
jgi:hypothetical protein